MSSSSAVAIIDDHPSCSSSPSTLSTNSSLSNSQTSSTFFNGKNDTEILEQCWYWGAATKEEITAAMDVSCKFSRNHAIDSPSPENALLYGVFI